MLTNPTVTIGIPAYNAEKNIRRLLESLLNQKTKGFILEKIIVYSDQSEDNTKFEVTKIKSKKIEFINAKVRKGYAHGLKEIIRLNDANLMILLNDDIIITDPNFISKGIAPFINEKNVGLVCTNPQPLKPQNFVEKSIISGFNAFDKMRYHFKNGNNCFTVDGKTLIGSNDFLKNFNFPANYKQMGTVDDFFYFECLKKGYKYRHIKNALSYYRLPSNWSDYVKWMTRNYSNQYIFRKRFGKLAEREYKIPVKAQLFFIYYRFTEFIKNPIGGIMIFIVGIYCSYKARSSDKWFSPTWEVVTSTKQLS